MNKQPLVSVIIPTYGGAQFLKRCIDSVINQTYEEIEVIVVDDNGIGSQNQLETSNIMAQYESNDSVKYVCHKVNINGSAARNTGFRHSKGEYIALLDDDDVFLPEKIERQVALLSSMTMEYGAVYCSHETFLRGEKVGEERAVVDGHFLYDYMMHRVEIASSSILIRRSVWENLNGFDESFKRHQDWEFISRLLNKYAIKSDDFYGFERLLQFRNSLVSPDVFKERRLFYLKKMDPIIKQFTPKLQKELIAHELFDISLYYAKKKDYLDFIKHLISIKPRFFVLRMLFHRFYKFAKNGGKIIK